MAEMRGCGGESEGQCSSCDWDFPDSLFSLQVFIVWVFGLENILCMGLKLLLQ